MCLSEYIYAQLLFSKLEADAARDPIRAPDTVLRPSRPRRTVGKAEEPDIVGDEDLVLALIVVQK